MIQILLDNPLLLLFTVVAVAYPLGRISVGGVSLGVAAVLFAGLAVGSLHPDLRLPEIVSLLGLVLFVYTVGLSNGRVFVASLGRKGLRDALLVLGMLGFAAALVVAAAGALRLEPAMAAGVFAGSLTNTPALAGVLEYLEGSVPEAALERLLAEPVVGYSATYPMGVVGTILAIALAQRVWKIDYVAEARRVREVAPTHRRLANRTLRVICPDATRQTIDELVGKHRWDVVFGRLRRDGQVSLATGETRLELGDLVSVVGAVDDLDPVTTCLGAPSDERLELDRSELDFRRIFISNPKLAGHRLRDLGLTQQFGAVVTRVRRGDVELVPRADTVLELGDRVRVVTPRQNMDAVTAFFGDSYRAVSEVDVLTFSLGLALGLLVGTVPIPLPGDVSFRLGLAGGPLVVALVLGALERTGSLVWTVSYSASLTLRQIGLILFLAGVGTRAGYAFVATITQGNGIVILLVGATVTAAVALTALWIGHRLLKIPMGMLIGMLAGLQTQPAVLSFALEQTRDELPNIGYARVYPIATIGKIVLAQLTLALLLPGGPR